MSERGRRVAVVTGSSGGIGLETARALAKKGFAVRLVGRDGAKLEAAKAQLARDAEGAGYSADLACFRADFSSLAEVSGFADALLARGEGLHVLIHNAGVWHPTFRRSKEGFEDTFAVNVLAPFLLTQRLLPRLRESGRDARIVHVSSRLHVQAGQTATLTGRVVHALNVLGVQVGVRGARLDLEALAREERGEGAGYRGLEAYARSKLAQLVFSRELARRETRVASNGVHPGSVATDVTRENALLYAFAPLSRLVLKSPAEGARTSVFVATSPTLVGVSGRYFAREREARAAAVVEDPALAAELWALAEARTGLASSRTPRA